MQVVFLSVFLPVLATCWFRKHWTSCSTTVVPQSYDAKKNIIVLWKRNEPVLKEASIFDGVRRACSVVDALTAEVCCARWHSGGIFGVSEVCGIVCNVKTVMFGSSSTEVMKHNVYSGWCIFYSYWENGFRFICGVQSDIIDTGPILFFFGKPITDDYDYCYFLFWINSLNEYSTDLALHFHGIVGLTMNQRCRSRCLTVDFTLVK